MRRYPLYYSGSNNFGDAINPVLYKYITGESCVLTQPEFQGKILSCGSIAHVALPLDIIWGSGCMTPDIPLKCDVTTQVLAVRGPLTAELLYKQTKHSTEIYYDPGLLISRYIFPANKTQKIGIIPHYTDKDIIISDPNLNQYYIDIMSGVEEVIRSVTTCDYIFSSALHGIVCAEAYEIPALWVEFSDNVAGNGFKFKDYYLGTRRQPPKPVDWRVNRDIDTAIELLEYSWQPPRYNDELFLSVCPFTLEATTP
jgi:pyruvyltransferase